MLKLNLGSGPDYREDATNIEHPSCSDLYKADVWWDLEKGLPFTQINLPFLSVDEIHANHILEHIRNLHVLMADCYNVLKEGGKFFIRVPFAFHLCAWGDPTHVRGFTPESFTKFIIKDRLQEHRKPIFKIEKLELWEDGQINVELVKL